MAKPHLSQLLHRHGHPLAVLLQLGAQDLCSLKPSEVQKRQEKGRFLETSLGLGLDLMDLIGCSISEGVDEK